MATHPLISMPSPMMWEIVPLPKENASSRNSMHESKNASPVKRAIADAQPFLTRAKSIALVTVSADGKSDEMREAAIARHLATTSPEGGSREHHSD